MQREVRDLHAVQTEKVRAAVVSLVNFECVSDLLVRLMSSNLDHMLHI